MQQNIKKLLTQGQVTPIILAKKKEMKDKVKSLVNLVNLEY